MESRQILQRSLQSVIIPLLQARPKSVHSWDWLDTIVTSFNTAQKSPNQSIALSRRTSLSNGQTRPNLHLTSSRKSSAQLPSWPVPPSKGYSSCIQTHVALA